MIIFRLVSRFVRWLNTNNLYFWLFGIGLAAAGITTEVITGWLRGLLGQVIDFTTESTSEWTSEVIYFVTLNKVWLAIVGILLIIVVVLGRIALRQRNQQPRVSQQVRSERGIAWLQIQDATDFIINNFFLSWFIINDTLRTESFDRSGMTFRGEQVSTIPVIANLLEKGVLRHDGDLLHHWLAMDLEVYNYLAGLFSNLEEHLTPEILASLPDSMPKTVDEFHEVMDSFEQVDFRQVVRPQRH